MLGDPDATGSEADMEIDEELVELQPDTYEGEHTTVGIEEALNRL